MIYDEYKSILYGVCYFSSSSSSYAEACYLSWLNTLSTDGCYIIMFLDIISMNCNFYVQAFYAFLVEKLLGHYASLHTQCHTVTGRCHGVID